MWKITLLKGIRLFVLVPALDSDFVFVYLAESLDIGSGKPAVGDKGNVEVNGSAPHFITVTQFVMSEILRNIDYKIHFMSPDEFQR